MTKSAEEEKRAYEERLKRRLEILKKELQEGKVTFEKDMQVIESLKAVRYAPDGSVDLSTVDASVRALALGIEAIHDREELKKQIPLAEIQTTYFDFLEQNFGKLYRIMVDRNMTPHQAGMALSRAPENIDFLSHRLPEFLQTIDDFWRNAADAAQVHVEDMRATFKGVFGGDLFPSNSENIASKCGVYVDTIILPDPFIRSKGLFEKWDQKKQAYYLIKHALNILQYKDLACADIQPPVVVILPDISEMREEEKEFFLRLGQEDAIIHAGKIFGRKFQSLDDMMKFAGSLPTVESAVEAIVDQRRILFDTNWDGDVREQITRALRDDQYGKILGTDNAGILLASQALGRMSVSNELLIKARRLRGTPIIDAPTSWQYLVWKLEYDAEKASQEINIGDLHILRGLESLAEKQMEWLGKVPPQALIELRKTGAMDEVRKILGEGIEELTLAESTNFYKTTDRILENIHTAFSDHRKKIQDLREKKWRFAGSSIGSWLVVGSLAVTAAATGRAVWGLAAYAADQLLDAPKLKSIPSSIREFANESNKIRWSPVGILFESSHRRRK